jgi:hypothetical protein
MNPNGIVKRSGVRSLTIDFSTRYLISAAFADDPALLEFAWRHR